LRTKRLLMLLGSVCLALMLVVPFVVACAAEAPAPGPAATPAPAKVYNWKCQESWSHSHISFNPRGFPRFCECVKERSNGQLIITPHPVGELVKSPDVPDALSKGVIDMCVYADSFYGGTMPEGIISWGLPMASECAEDVFAVYDRGLTELITEAYAEHGVRFAGMQTIGTWGIAGSNKRLEKLEDFKGLKIRALGAVGQVMERLGATPVAIAPEEIYTALQLGTVDAACQAHLEWVTSHWNEVADYQVMPPLLECTESFIVCPDSWDELPPDVKDAFAYCEREHAIRMIVECRIDELKKDATMPPDTLCVIPAEEMAKIRSISMEVWDDLFADKGPRCIKMVELIKDYATERGMVG
jgi:TRAP-type C4-dicarboxylate transport system substrate-binding protein